jgi:hypothetical protein
VGLLEFLKEFTMLTRLGTKLGDRDILRIAAYTQKIGEMAYRNETIEGIMFTSTKISSGLNLVIFPEKLRSPSSLELYDPDRELSNPE